MQPPPEPRTTHITRPTIERELIVAERFRGPTRSGNGGYTAGMLARFLDGSAQVTLRRPPPLARSLHVRRTADGTAELLDGEVVIAEAVRAGVQVEPRPPVGLADAGAASVRYPGFAKHPFPECFVCGPHRLESDGLRIFPGPLAEGEGVAAPWVPDPGLAGPAGNVRPEFVWAALDCPGAFASGFPDTPMVLGRLAVEIRSPISCGTPYVVAGWPEGVDGRKHLTTTAVFGTDGEVLATGHATWIAIGSAELDAQFGPGQ